MSSLPRKGRWRKTKARKGAPVADSPLAPLLQLLAEQAVEQWMAELEREQTQDAVQETREGDA